MSTSPEAPAARILDTILDPKYTAVHLHAPGEANAVTSRRSVTLAAQESKGGEGIVQERATDLTRPNSLTICCLPSPMS
jgi:hypothetical protein